MFWLVQNLHRIFSSSLPYYAPFYLKNVYNLPETQHHAKKLEIFSKNTIRNMTVMNFKIIEYLSNTLHINIYKLYPAKILFYITCPSFSMYSCTLWVRTDNINGWHVITADNNSRPILEHTSLVSGHMYDTCFKPHWMFTHAGWAMFHLRKTMNAKH